MGIRDKNKQNTGKTVEYEDKNQKTRIGTILKQGRKRLLILTSNNKKKWITSKQIVKIWEV